MCLFWTQRKIFWRKFVIRLFWGTIDFNSRRKNTALFPSFFRISSFVFRTNTFIQVWIYLRMSEWWQDFNFWVNCPFKRENSWKQLTCNSVLDPDFGLKGEALQYSFCLPLILIKQQSLTALDYHFCNFNKNKLKNNNNDIFIYSLCIESIHNTR